MENFDFIYTRNKLEFLLVILSDNYSHKKTYKLIDPYNLNNSVDITDYFNEHILEIMDDDDTVDDDTVDDDTDDDDINDDTDDDDTNDDTDDDEYERYDTDIYDLDILDLHEHGTHDTDIHDSEIINYKDDND